MWVLGCVAAFAPPRQAPRHGCLESILTIFVNSEGHIRGDDLVVTNLAELEGTVSVHRLHLQDAVILLSLDDGGFVGLLLEDR